MHVVTASSRAVKSTGRYPVKAPYGITGSVAIHRRGSRRPPTGSVGLSGRFELELLADKLDRLSQNGDAETEGALDDAGLAADVTRDVEG
jgi:hypothetical protein